MSEKVVSYVRVSTQRQTVEGGPDRQREAIAGYCAQHGLELVREFFEGVTGTAESIDRPVFSELLIFLEQDNSVTAIVIEKLDRLARELLVQESIIAILRKRSVRVYSADQGALIDLASTSADPARDLFRQFLGMISQFEKKNLCARMAAGLRRKKALTGRGAGNLPFGVAKDPAVQFAERTVLAAMVAMAEETPRPSYEKITRRLNEAGLRNRVGNPWTRQQVYVLLKRLGKVYRDPSISW